jgi:flavin reductase (DIM6/NTAB) family NADH-FMN oxidoreductase RutF
MALDPVTFRSVLGRFASGITVVATRDETGRDHGLTVSAFCSLSLEPPLVLICVARTASLHPVLLSAPGFAVSILSAGQESLARRFAEPDAELRFEEVGFTRGPSGAALIDDALAHLECRIVQRVDGGDHTIFMAEVEWTDVHEERPLLYYRGGYAQLER